MRSRRVLRQIVLTVLLLAGAATAHAVKYYVDAEHGADANPGTSAETAWKTLAAASAHIFVPSDAVLFHAGQRFTGTFLAKGNGTEALPIVVGRYSTGDAPELTGSADRATVLLSNVSFWTVRDIAVSNDATTSGNRTGILVEATQPGEVVRGIHIAGVHVHNVRGATGIDNAAKDTGGVGFFAPHLSAPARFADITVERCTIEHVDNIGIWLDTYPSLNPRDPAWESAHSAGVRFVSNVISDTGRNAIILRSALNPLIAGNHIDHASARFHGNAIFTRSTRGAVMRGNEVAHTGTGSSGENGAFDADIDSQNTLIEMNWSHDNEGGLFVLCNNPDNDENVTDTTVVRFNVSENDGERIFGFSGHVTNSAVYNNTAIVYGNHTAKVLEVRPFSHSKPEWVEGATFFNNIIVLQGSGTYDYGGGRNMRFDSECIVGAVPVDAPQDNHLRHLALATIHVPPQATSRQEMLQYRPLAAACGEGALPLPTGASRDVTGAMLPAHAAFRGAIAPLPLKTSATQP
jgi:cyclophilin family peptidyl-prolyl cis-trans isomerase